MLSETIKALRKQANMSQEQLAEQLHVSRQAVTKWETNMGMPDIDNLRGISMLFQVSIDDLLGNSIPVASTQDFLFDSITEYDIDFEKHYDITFSGAKQVYLSGYEGEKIRLRLASNQIAEIQSAFKVKIDDLKRRIDIDIRRLEPMNELKAKETIHLFISFPQKYVKGIELCGNTERLTIQEIELDNLEFSGKVKHVLIDRVISHLEFDSNEDMELICKHFSGKMDVNQISSTSQLYVPAGFPFVSVLRGIGNHIFYYKDGNPCENFSLSGEEAKHCENILELNGLKSELAIHQVTEPS